MNWYGYVYKTINLLNGKIYIGQKKGSFDRSYHGSGLLIKRAIVLHGKHSFKTEVLSFACDKLELDELERQHIRAHRDSLPQDVIYNIADGGQGGNFPGMSGPGELNPRWGAHLSDETKRKIGEANKKIRGNQHGNYGKIRSAETRLKISRSKKGHSSNWNRGKSWPDWVKKKLSESAKKVYMNRTRDRKGRFSS